ncbi:hypothetical protein ACOBQJ_02995 [Pelotomaculum propionicicum]|uniref:hypothetical protein n=1 Tax=Pelotomaculum propionicicum TaxID=258475 RepID=UPI003B7FF2B9
MPLFIFIVAALIVVFGIVVYKARTSKETGNTKSKVVNWIIFGVSLIALIISLKLFYNMALYADEYGSSPVLVCGGWFWLCMDWFRLGLLFLLCLISSFNAFKRTK